MTRTLALLSALALAGLLALLILPCDDTGQGDADAPPLPLDPADRPPTCDAPDVPLDHVGQEVWITYRTSDPENRRLGMRTGRKREEALAIAQRLYEAAHGGAPIAQLANQASNAPGALAGGFSGWWPVLDDSRESRDRALIESRVGELTPLIDWRDGYWFARKVGPEQARRLYRSFVRLQCEAVSIQAIYVPHRDVDRIWIGEDAPPSRRMRTREQAVAFARERILEPMIEEGRPFHEFLAYSSDVESRRRGGLVRVARPDEDGMRWTRWLVRGEPYIPRELVQAAFEGEEGEVVDRVFDTWKGVFVIRVVEKHIP